MKNLYLSQDEVKELFKKALGDSIDNYKMPQPIFAITESQIVAYDEINKTLVLKMPIKEQWLNVYDILQGGMIDVAVDNAIGSLSMLVAPISLTRTIETKILKAIKLELSYIYVEAKFVEQKKRRLIFEAKVLDEDRNIYATSKMVNFII